MRSTSSGALRALLLSLAALAAASPAGAQLASSIRAETRAGQTFVVWRESTASSVRYRVYRSTSPIRTAADLARADVLGEVDDKSSSNPERSRVENAQRTWVIAEGAAPLAPSDGLFVHTLAGDAAQAFYAVTGVRQGNEDRTVVPGRNATELGLVERAAPPEPVLQVRTSRYDLWGHWVSDRDTPHQPALALVASQAFAFSHEPGRASSTRGLLVRLHPAGGSYAQGWPLRNLLPADVDVLALSDLHPPPGFTFWFGTHARFPDAPTADTRVLAFTQARILWTLDWLGARLATLDPERVYLAGSSLGATGGMYLVAEAPERFAAAVFRSGNYDLEAGDYSGAEVYESVFGSFALDLATPSGLPILTRTNARAMARLDRQLDWPLIRTLDGRWDERVGWASAVALYEGLAETWRPAAHYFDERVHAGTGDWSALERTLVLRTCRVRRDRPSLHFGAFTLDDEAGDGRRTRGDDVGTLAGRVEYDPATATATSTLARFDVYLRDEGALDDAQASTGFAVLTPRRTGAFAPAPGEAVRFTLLQGSTKIAEHWLTADAYGLVHTPPVPLTTTRRQARFER